MGRKGVSKRKTKKANVKGSSNLDKGSVAQPQVKSKDAAPGKGSANPSAGSNGNNKKGR